MSKEHPHAAFIAEALLDLDRDIVFYNFTSKKWEDFPLQNVIHDYEDEFHCRFKDTAPEKHKIVSSLTDDEIADVWVQGMRNVWDTLAGRRALVNAAAQRAVEDLPMPTLDWALNNLDISDNRSAVLKGIRKYIQDLKEGKL